MKLNRRKFLTRIAGGTLGAGAAMVVLHLPALPEVKKRFSIRVGLPSLKCRELYKDKIVSLLPENNEILSEMKWSRKA